jgi:hypothetical protein
MQSEEEADKNTTAFRNFESQICVGGAHGLLLVRIIEATRGREPGDESFPSRAGLSRSLFSSHKLLISGFEALCCWARVTGLTR